MSKLVVLGSEAREQLKIGIDILANAVKSTLGPGGKTVILAEDRDVTITKDGVSVANQVFLPDPIQNIGAQIVKEVAAKTAAQAGDGTTTATVLAQAMINYNQVPSKEDLNAMLGYLKIQSKECESLKAVAAISANNNQAIGELVEKALNTTGVYGIVTPDISSTTEDELIITQGIHVEEGFLSTTFITDLKKATCELDNPIILIYSGDLKATSELSTALYTATQAKRDLLIIADSVEGPALYTLEMTHTQGSIKCCAIRTPGVGVYKNAQLNDIAALTYGEVIQKSSGKLVYTEKHLGEASKVIVGKEFTTIIGITSEEGNPVLESRIEMIKDLLETTSEGYETQFLEKRLAQLTGGTAIIGAGGYSRVEKKERKDRIEDAIFAATAARDSGILPGGGVALYHLSDIYPEYTKVLQAPFRQILTNAGIDTELESKEFEIGINAITGKVGNMFEMGIVDPYLVVSSALINAYSIATTFLNTECIITNIDGNKTRGPEYIPAN